MRGVPRLLNNSNTVMLPSMLFSDLQIDKILSTHTVSVLRQPCKPNEIVLRNELFVLLDKDENHTRVKNVLSVLSANERALYVFNDAKTPLERYCRATKTFESYIASCDILASMRDMGGLFSCVADYFSSGEKKKVFDDMKESIKKIKNLLRQMSVGLLTFADKNWLTADYDAVSEFDNMSECAKNLGFAVPEKKQHNTKINIHLSDAICRLYKDKTEEIEGELKRYADIDFLEPVSYISEIKFFLDIYDLVQRAANVDVPHCISKIAKTPEYKAKELYDISLLAKKCENIVPNDADFNKAESFCFLLGANGGGKTTYLRAVGINLILFLAGCPVFAEKAEIYPFDVIFSHFPKDERFDNTGRLDEEKKRVEEMLNMAKDKVPFLFFNETFSGADEKRGFELLTAIVSQIVKSNYFGVYVTHFYEVMTLDYPVLSAEVDLSDANKRTFRIVKYKGGASSYAADILKKYRLDKDSLSSRRWGNGN